MKVTLLGSLLSALANQASSTLETGRSPGRLGNAHPSIAPYETFECEDQRIALAVGTDAQFGRLCEVLGVPGLAVDARFADNPSRVAYRGVLKHLLEDRLALRPAAEWIERLTVAGVPAGRVNSIAQAIEFAESLGLEPVASTRAKAPDGSAHTLRSIANPISFSATPAVYDSPPPMLDEHDGAEWWPLDIDPRVSRRAQDPRSEG